MVQASCATCGAAFEAKTGRARYCSGACKKRAADRRARTGQVVALADRRPSAAPEDPPDSDDATGLADSLRTTFAEEDLATPAGQIALRLARDVDRLIPGTPGYAGIVAQMRAAVDDLRSQAKPRKATPLTLLRERRAADAAAGAV